MGAPEHLVGFRWRSQSESGAATKPTDYFAMTCIPSLCSAEGRRLGNFVACRCGVDSRQPHADGSSWKRRSQAAGAQLPNDRAGLSGEHAADRQGAGGMDATQLLFTRCCRSDARTLHPHRGSDVSGSCRRRLRGHWTIWHLKLGRRSLDLNRSSLGAGQRVAAEH